VGLLDAASVIVCTTALVVALITVTLASDWLTT
jgi:hypothetical protein